MTAVALATVLLGAAACNSFSVRRYTTSSDLFKAGLAQYRAGKWQNAIDAFERLTFDLPARDTLLAPSHWYLAHARRKNLERLLAAQSFIRIGEQFPDDTLADDALFWSGKSYREMWRTPDLDPQYGILAQAQFRVLLGLYPDSPFADSALVELKELDEWFAKKDFVTGMHYVRRRAYDSGIIYLRDVVAHYPNTDYARRAMLELVRVYRLPTMNYVDDANEVCEALRAGFPEDRDVLAACKLPTG